MNNLLSYKPCCYEWEAQGNDVVKEKNSKQIYGAVTKDIPSSLSKKFGILILAQPIVNTLLHYLGGLPTMYAT